LGAAMSKSRLGLVILTVLACALLALPALADSQARIVRLSDVQGSVQIDKNTGMGFESAFLNLPVTQGTQLRTRDNGRAEVEFEDGSTMRLTPNSLVQFSTLGLSDDGTRVSVINLVDGMAYVNWLGKKGDKFTLNFAHEKIALDRSAHFRVDTATNVSQVGVFNGDLEIESPSGNVALNKKKMATFEASDDKSTVANLEPNAYDDWDKQAVAYHDQYAKNNSSPYGYGYSDLNYYGGYQNVPGYGMMWQPYFAGVGWDPFMDGAWSFYPGFGYMFVSAYPWGWMPYLYGNWLFVPGFGWMWQPGYWNTWGTVPRFAGTLPAHFTAPVAPKGNASTVVFGKGGPVAHPSTPSHVVLRNGSAGMGIARGSLSNMHQLNHQVARSGSAEVHTAPPFAASSSRSGFGGNSGGHSSASAGAPSSVSAGHAASAGGGGHPAHH